VQNNFKNKLALYMFDSSDINAIVGRSAYPLGEIKGRGLVKLENVNQIQTYVAVSFEKTLDYSEKIKALVDSIDQQYTGMRPKPIPMLPEELSFELFDEFIPRGLGKNLIPVALDTENVEVQQQLNRCPQPLQT